MSDKQIVLEWLKNHAKGYRKATHLKTLLDSLYALIPGIENRYLRVLLSELKHDGEIGALSSIGYWYIPPVVIGYDDADEVDMAKRSWLENKSRAMSLLTDCDKHIKQLEDRLKIARQGQGVLL